MISIDAIDEEIINLEKRDTSFATIERLAWLYTVRDHLAKGDAAQDQLSIHGNEFCECCDGADVRQVMQVMAEHMDAIKALYPNEYRAIIGRINSIKNGEMMGKIQQDSSKNL